MFQNIIQDIGVWISGILISIAGFFSPTIPAEIPAVPSPDLIKIEKQIKGIINQVDFIQKQIVSLGEISEKQLEEITFGATQFVAGGRYKLYGSGIGTTDTSIVLQSLTHPISGVELVTGDFGNIGYATIEPGTSKKEFISFTGVTQSGSTAQATLTGVTRGLDFISPYTSSTTLAQTHSGGSVLIFSNPPQVYEQFAIKDNDATIAGDWNWVATATPQYLSNPSFTAGSNEFASINYVDTVATSGAANATDSVAGIVELATLDEILSGVSATGTTNAYLVISIDSVATTTTATTSIVATESDGKLNQNFLDLTEAFSFSSTTLATTTIDNTLDVTGAFGASSTVQIFGNLTASAASTTFDWTQFNTFIPLLPTATPTEEYHSASKAYVDQESLRFVEISPNTASTTGIANFTWTDWDISSYVSQDAKIAEIIMGGKTGPDPDNETRGIRANGSSVDRTTSFQNFSANAPFRISMSIDLSATTIVEIYSEAQVNASTTWEITGYWK